MSCRVGSTRDICSKEICSKTRINIINIQQEKIYIVPSSILSIYLFTHLLTVNHLSRQIILGTIVDSQTRVLLTTVGIPYIQVDNTQMALCFCLFVCFCGVYYIILYYSMGGWILCGILWISLWFILARYLLIFDVCLFVSIELFNIGSYCLMPIRNLIAMNLLFNRRRQVYVCNKYVNVNKCKYK